MRIMFGKVISHLWTTMPVLSLATAAILATAPPGMAQERCDEGFVWREAFARDYACVTPDTRTQAQQDNAAAASRWVSGTFGPDECNPGYVWREAQPGDRVCVLPSRRDLARIENAEAAQRTSDQGNPRLCLPGSVWREAYPGDVTCVLPLSRTWVREDNARAEARRGSRTCAPGFVWREAGPEDWVCVTPQVREQARLDNIAYNNRSRVAGARCNRYGEAAVAAFRQAQALGCRVSGPRWQDNVTNHVNWCNTEASRALAEREERARATELRSCASGQGSGSGGGATSACAVSVQVANTSCVNLDGTPSSLQRGILSAFGCGPDEASARSIAEAFFRTQSCIGGSAGCCEVAVDVLPGCFCR